MQYVFMALFGAGIVAADQLSKLWVVKNIALHTEIPAIPHIFHLTYVQNTGAAFSMFRGQQWLFAILFLLLTAALIWEFTKKPLGLSAFERWCADFAKANNMNFTITVSDDPAQAAEAVKRYLV